MTMLSFRSDRDHADRLAAWAERLDIGRSELLRRAVHKYLTQLDSELDAGKWRELPLSEAEASLAEIAEWGPAEDWSDWA